MIRKSRRFSLTFLALGILVAVAVLYILNVVADHLISQPYERDPNVIELRAMGVPVGGHGNLVTVIEFGEDDVGDSLLQYVKRWENIDRLALNNLRCTGQGLAFVPVPNKVKSLNLLGSAVTDEALKHLQRWPNLESLSLNGTAITGTGLRYLQPVHSLRTLSLCRVSLTHEGVANLETLTQLTRLKLIDATIRDDDLPHLSFLTGLEYLDLPGTKITDAGLVHLRKLTRLKEISLSYTKVTRDGAASLSKSLPNTKIWAGTPPKNDYEFGPKEKE